MKKRAILLAALFFTAVSAQNSLAMEPEAGQMIAELPETEEELTDGTEVSAEAEETFEIIPEETIRPEEITIPEEIIIPEETTVPEETTRPEETAVPEEITIESGDETLSVSEGNAEDPAGTEQEFVVKVFGKEAAVTSRSEDGEVLVCSGYGVLFVKYSVSEDGVRTPASAVCWDEASDVWSNVDAEGVRTVTEPGFYRFYGNTVWHIGSKGSGVGGYVVDGDAWSYYLGYGDLASGLASKAGADGLLPEKAYHGAQWSGSDVLTVKGGYHSYNSGKYYFLKNGTILCNGTMKVGDRYYEFGADGRCIRSYNINYWKKERLGYYVRVDGQGNIIRTAGFYKIDGETYFLCGNSGRRVQGWFSLKGCTYYFDKETGVMAAGYQVIDGVPYYFDPASGKKMVGNVFINGKRYYFSYKDGQLVTGWITGGANGDHKYYVNEDGSLKLGWSRIASENRTYYFEPTWGYALSGFQTIDGKRYLFVPGTDAVGRGWLTVNGDRYYSDPSTAVLTTGFAVISGRNYYFDASGKMITSQERYEIDGKVYAFDEWGHYTEVLYTEVQQLARDRLDVIGWSLREAYDWSVMSYTHIDDTVPEGYTPADYYGLYGLRNHTGDCYVMAATFYQMAAQLGYDAHFVMGYVPLARGGMGPHGWVEIDQDGGTYVYDPDFEYDDGKNGYKIYYGKPGTWMYSDYYRTN